jgi:hypothetical protein
MPLTRSASSSCPVLCILLFIGGARTSTSSPSELPLVRKKMSSHRIPIVQIHAFLDYLICCEWLWNVNACNAYAYYDEDGTRFKVSVRCLWSSAEPPTTSWQQFEVHENWHDGEIAKSSEMVVVEVWGATREIVKYIYFLPQRPWNWLGSLC